MLTEKNARLGFLMLIFWCVFSSVGNVLVGNVEQAISPLELCFYLFILVNFIFLLLNVKRLRHLISETKMQWKYVAIINVTTFFCWYFLIYPMKFIEPSIASVIVLGTIPIATWLSGIFIYKNQTVRKTDVLFSSLLASGMIYLSMVCVLNKTGIGIHHDKKAIIFSLVLAIIGGFALAINAIYTKKLSNAGWKPLDVLVVRFWLILFLGGVAASTHHFSGFSESLIVPVISTALLLIVVPQIVYQIALRELEPLSLAIVPPMMPVLTFFIEFFDHRLHPTDMVLIGLLFIGCCSLFASWIRYYQAIQSETGEQSKIVAER